MFNNTTKNPKLKSYNFIDALQFLCAFSEIYQDDYNFDEATANILIDVIKLAKTQYQNDQFYGLSEKAVEDCLDLVKDDSLKFKMLIDKMTSSELREMEKQSNALGKKIIRKIEQPIESEINSISEEINELSWLISIASSKKEQDIYFKRQDDLFAKEDEENNRIKSQLDSELKAHLALSNCFCNTQYTYSKPVKTASEKLKSFFESKETKILQDEGRNL